MALKEAGVEFSVRVWLTALREPWAWSGLNSLILLFQRIVFKASEAWILLREPGRASVLSLQPGEIPPAGLYHLQREWVPRAGGTEPLPTLTACGSVNLISKYKNKTQGVLSKQAPRTVCLVTLELGSRWPQTWTAPGGLLERIRCLLLSFRVWRSQNLGLGGEPLGCYNCQRINSRLTESHRTWRIFPHPLTRAIMDSGGGIPWHPFLGPLWVQA